MKNISDKDINEIKQAAQQGRIDDYIDKRLSPEASKKLRQVLSDKSATEKLLQTPEAKALMDKLMNK